MRRRGILLGIAGLALSAAIAFAVIRTSPPPPPPPPSDPPPPLTYGPIRTDLADYRWPTDVTRNLTSTFGEFRSTHFHAGIDISTRDRIGARVLAARDGHVVRISVRPTGYGKILYLRHADDYTTTYAHLDRFSPTLEEIVKAEQQRRGVYTVTLRFKEDEIPVTRGELIAYSGETGSGTPHLHFEIRDEQGNGVNPMLCPEYQILDTISPAPRRLAFVPLGPGSTVNGKDVPITLALHKESSGTYSFAGPVVITGQAGIALYIRDRSNGTWFRHGVYRHSLKAGGRSLLQVVFDRVPINEDQQIGLYYQWEMYLRRKGRFQKLYIDSGHELPLYTPDSVGAGILSSTLLPHGHNDVRIETEDFNGNTTVIAGEILLSTPPQLRVRPERDSMRIELGSPGEARWVYLASMNPGQQTWSASRRLKTGGSTSMLLPFESAPGRVIRIIAENDAGVRSTPWFHFTEPERTRGGSIELELEQRDGFIKAVLTSTGTLTDTPHLSIQEGDRHQLISLTVTDLNRAEGWFLPGADYGGVRIVRAAAEVGGEPRATATALELYPLIPGRGDNYSIDDGRLRIRSTPESVYDTVWMNLERDQSAGNGRRYRLGPPDVVLRRGIAVTMEGDKDNTGDLYVRGRGGWSLIARALPGTTPVTGRLGSSLGELALLADTRGPSVQTLRFPVLSRRKVRFSFSYDDDLSGVDYDSLKTYIDGAVVIAEIDGEHHRVHYQSNDPLERGPHLLTVRLRDNVGNLTTVDRRFVVP